MAPTSGTRGDGAPVARSVVRRVDHRLDAEVEVWSIDLERYARVGRLSAFPATERTSVDQPAPSLDRQRRLASHHALRWLLGRRLDVEPERVPIIRDASSNKPRLDDIDLEFNLSHSGGRALVALSSRPVGVDVEQLRGVPAADALVEEHFTDSERRGWLRVPPAIRSRRFLACWTKKEALAKALGIGVARGLPQVEVGYGLRPVDVTYETPDGMRNLTVSGLDLGHRFIGAVAVVTDTTSRPDRPAASGVGLALR